MKMTTKRTTKILEIKIEINNKEKYYGDSVDIYNINVIH